MKTGEKVTCPFCGAEIDPDSLQCPSCGNTWSDAEEREVIRAVRKIPGMGEKRTKKLFEAGFERIKDADEDDLQEILKKAGIPMRIAEEVKDHLETKTSLHMCPECGAFVPADAKKCPICDADLSAGEEEIDFTPTEVNDVSQLKDDLFEDEDREIYVCMVCGAFITDDREKCPVCGASMPENRADMPLFSGDVLEDEERNIRAIQGFFGVQDVNKLDSVDLSVLESVTELDICSSCGAFVRPEARKCPVCGSDLVPELDEEEIQKATDEALLELESLKSELIGADLEDLLPEEEEYQCPECGMIVPASAESCPGCGVRFVEEGSPDESEKSSSEELVLSLEDVLAEEEIRPNETESPVDRQDNSIDDVQTLPLQATSSEEARDEEEPEISGKESEEEERIKEEIKEEVDFIFAPLPSMSPSISHREEEAADIEKEELAKVLEGGLDEISPPEERAVDERAKALIKDDSFEVAQSRWTWYKDIVMATSAIGAALMASEYLLTNGVVPDPMMAYGFASVAVFIPLLIAGFVLTMLDRKFIFGEAWANMASASILIFSLLIPLLWFLPVYVSDHLKADIVLTGLYFADLIALWILIKDRMDPFWIWFLGVFQISVHSLIFINGNYPWTGASDPLPSYILAFTGGVALSLGIYLRIDAAVRSLLATRDAVMGHRYYMGGDYEAAMKYYTRAMNRKRSHEPGYDLAYYGKGTALLSAGNHLEALKYLNRAVKSNPNNDRAWNNRGIALSNLGLDDGALASYERALQINPQYDVAWNNKGNVLARMGRYREALKCYDRALEINPEYKDAWMNKGYVLIKMDRYREAKECADHVLRPEKRRAVPRRLSMDLD